MSNLFSKELFEKVPIVGILRGFSSRHVEQTGQCYADAGLTNLEVTMNSEKAVETITLLKKSVGKRLNIGAGTVSTPEDLKMALDAGAEFIVTPIINEKVIQKCVECSIPVFPGAFTPTEIYQAWAMGAFMVKVFPAATLGADYIKQVRAPFDQIKLLPTGGISLDNMQDFFEAGAKGVGIGSQLIPKHLVEGEDWGALSRHFSIFFNTYKSLIDENKPL